MFALPYDLQKDFQPVSLVSSDPLIIVARKTSRERSEGVCCLAEGKSGPGNARRPLARGCWDSGRATFSKRNGDALPVRALSWRPGSSHAGLVAVRSTSWSLRPPIPWPTFVLAPLRPYAVTSKNRLSRRHLIPNSRRGGVAGALRFELAGVLLSQATPRDVAARLNTAVVTTLADPVVRRRLADLGQEVFPRDQQTSEALRAFQDAEIERWWPIVRAANIKGE